MTEFTAIPYHHQRKESRYENFKEQKQQKEQNSCRSRNQDMNIPKNKNTKKKKTRVVLNISGEIFETHESTLARFPTSLLGNKPARLQYFHSDHYFFERNRVCFEAILHFYQSNGTLNCPMVRAPNFWSPFFTPHNFSSPVF